MACWLLKTEPGTYSFADLQREKRTVWEGVANALAQQHLRAARAGDEALVYHTGEEKAVVGVARIASDPYPDPGDAAGKRVVLDVEPLQRLPAPVTLGEIKADPAFRDFALVRNSRLSVMPVPEPLRSRLRELGGL